MATYTPPSLDEPGGWEFTEAEKLNEADKHFAHMCEADDTVLEAFCADAWGDEWTDKARQLGEMLNEYRHAKRQGHNNHKDLLLMSIGKLFVEPAHDYIDFLAQEKANDTIADTFLYEADMP